AGAGAGAGACAGAGSAGGRGAGSNRSPGGIIVSWGFDAFVSGIVASLESGGPPSWCDLIRPAPSSYFGRIPQKSVVHQPTGCKWGLTPAVRRQQCSGVVGRAIITVPASPPYPALLPGCRAAHSFQQLFQLSDGLRVLGIGREILVFLRVGV